VVGHASTSPDVGAETMVVVALVMGHAWRGSSMRNTDGTMIDATSSGALMIMVIVEGMKRVHHSQGWGRSSQAWKEGGSASKRSSLTPKGSVFLLQRRCKATG